MPQPDQVRNAFHHRLEVPSQGMDITSPNESDFRMSPCEFDDEFRVLAGFQRPHIKREASWFEITDLRWQDFLIVNRRVKVVRIESVGNDAMKSVRTAAGDTGPCCLADRDESICQLFGDPEQLPIRSVLRSHLE